MTIDYDTLEQPKMRTQSKAQKSHPPILPFLFLVLIVCLQLLVMVVYLQQFLLKGSDGIKVNNPKNNDPTIKRWAVMMVGAGRSYLFTRNSFLQNVVKQTNPPMDLFVFTRKISNSSCLVDLESMRLLENDSTAIHLDENYLEGEHPIFKVTKDRFVRQHTETLQMIETFAEQQSINYDYVFYTRPDLYYTLPFNIKELEQKFENKADWINGTLFSPQCCAWDGWCDQIAAAPYKDFARMIKVSREWFARGDNIGSTVPEHEFRARGQFANLSNFDLRLKEDYGFLLLRLTTAMESCRGSHNLYTYWRDAICNDNAPFDFIPAPGTCEILNSSSFCDK